MILNLSLKKKSNSISSVFQSAHMQEEKNVKYYGKFEANERELLLLSTLFLVNRSLQIQISRSLSFCGSTQHIHEPSIYELEFVQSQSFSFVVSRCMIFVDI